MNQKDYYQKEEYGATYTTDISTEKMKEEGQKAAATILARLRQKSEIGNDTPILICMFKQAPNDSLVGGSFYAPIRISRAWFFRQPILQAFRMKMTQRRSVLS